MADEKTDKPSGQGLYHYFVRSMFEDDPLEQWSSGFSRGVYVIPAHGHQHHLLGERCLPFEEPLWRREYEPLTYGLTGAIRRTAPAPYSGEAAHRAAQEFVEAERWHELAVSGLPLKMRSHGFESVADMETAAEQETQDKPPVKDDERLEQIREALEKSRELGKRAQSGIDALVERSR